ncbi:MAG TPA: gfo/Idh/MocA family oxidoreductase [Treponema sp.]|nr:gfo/Idh/MocA family oxidoreductase [Treponema sp.]
MRRRPKYTAVIIGTGRIGFSLGLDRKREQPASHTMALLADNRIRLIAGCDSNATHLDDWHRYCKRSTVYSSYAHLFAACSPDIVVIAVNESAHLETALAAIRSRPKLLILEKPVALTMSDGLQIADAAVKNNVPVMVNHERRFALDYAAAKSYMDALGCIQSVTAELDSSLRVYSSADEATGAYSLLHDGTHLVDIVRFLLAGKADTAAESAGKRSLLYDPVITSVYYDEKEQSVVRNVSVHFASDRCPDVTVRISGRSRFFGFGVDVCGTEGRIRIGNGYAEFYRREQSKLYSGFYSLAPDKSVKLPKKTGYFSNMVKNAVDYLDGKSPLKSTLQDGLADLDVLEQIRALLKDEERN